MYMPKEVQNPRDRGKWVTVRDEIKSDSGYSFPKYEALLIRDQETKHVQGDIVLVKETNPITGHVRKYQIPKKAFERVANWFD